MSNPKVFEFAREVGLEPLALMDKIRKWKLPIKSHMAELEPDQVEQIQTKLNEEKGAGKAGKKVTVKKTATAATAKKKEAAPEKPAAKATATKAAPKATKTIARPTKTETPAKAAAKAEEAAKAATSASKVIRRKKDSEIEAAKEAERLAAIAAAEAAVEEIPEEVHVAPPVVEVEVEESTPPPAAVVAKEAPAATPVAPAAEVAEPPAKVAAASVSPITPARRKEVAIGQSGHASPSQPMQLRRNIVGRMDLSRVQAPSRPGGPSGDRGPSGPGGGGPSRPTVGGGPTRTANRNIRPGFVPSAPVGPIGGADDDRRSRFDERSKKSKVYEAPTVTPTVREKEEEVQEFNQSEFRKRELVFQPKKKKGSLGREAMKTQITKAKASKRVVKVYGVMKVADLAHELQIKSPQLIKTLMGNGVMATLNTELDFDTISLIAPEFGYEAQNVQRSAEDVVIETAFGDLNAEKVERPPVVTVMGHVDHGKTSLLDAIRKTDVAGGEAGGITQHIGAYQVKLDTGHLVTFLDTPGHEAFTAMRARGANATDIAVIVVAADDGVMPQTAEAISHAKAANVPIIIAVNKIDKPGANVDRIKQQLTEHEIVPEEWGGNAIFCEVSALKKTGIKEMLEQIHLIAEVGELRANPKRSGTGLVIEAKLERGQGPTATILVQDGTVEVGQVIVAGAVRGRVRSLTNDRGERVKTAGPGMPVQVLGLESTPMAGDKFDIVVDDEAAEHVVAIRKELALAKATVSGKVSLEEIFAKVTRGDVKELGVILKADVAGSLEAVQGMLGKIVTQEVKIRVIHAQVGGVTESDVLLAKTSKAIIIGFGVRPDTGAAATAKREGIEVRTYSIVYELIDDVKKAMAGLLAPSVVEKVMGRAEVRNVFTVPKAGAIAGSFVVDGKISRSNMVRLLRDSKIIYEGKIGSLRRFKDDAREVQTGFECGIGIENFNDIKVGDVIEAFVKEEVARELTPMAET